MEMSVMHLDETLSHIRAGKANVHILDQVMVNSYGSMVPVNNVAAITTPDSRTIAIKPWDKNRYPQRASRWYRQTQEEHQRWCTRGCG